MTGNHARAFITSMHKEGNISLDDQEVVKATADKHAVAEELVIACIEHLRDLSVNKARRDNEKTKKKEENREMQSTKTTIGLNLLYLGN